MDKNISLEEQKQLQLEMLKEVKRICNKNNINYFLGGGTLLGAIRHQGYIPWDDDIDIMLPRQDYKKLLHIFNQETNKQYKLLSYENTEDYYYPFAKIVHLKTKLVENECREIKDLGIFIDVFPIDFLPNNNKKVKNIFKKYKKVFRTIIMMYKAKNIGKVTTDKKKLIMKKILLPIMEKYKLHTKILKRIDNLTDKYNNTARVACISGLYEEREIMPSSYISDFTLAKFEDEEYKVPIGYDEYLTKHYGNYMELPPKEKQISSHDFICFWR